MMSWWPSSSPAKGTAAQPQQPSDSSQTQTRPATTPLDPPPSLPSRAPHDPDFYAAHAHLAPPSFSTAVSPATAGSPSTTTTTTTKGDLDPSLPRTMSCRAAFDSAFYCSSLGGHFNDLYRYGQLRSCNEHWSDFWFCMRTKNSYSGREVKERMVQHRYMEKEEKLKSGPNSEHVWARRGPGEEVKRPFGATAENGEGKE